MLFIQDITLSWNKAERGSKCARIRAQFPPAHKVDELPHLLTGEVIVHCLNFFQDGTAILNSIQKTRQVLKEHLPKIGFDQEKTQNEIERRILYDKKIRLRPYASIRDLNLTNLSIQSNEDGYEVTFFYDQQRSKMPTRRGHNKDYHNPNSSFYCQDILNETAFILKEDQYGRIFWNERKRDYDTGIWYYELHIINLIHSISVSNNKTLEPNIFLTHNLDYEYKQLATLF